MRGLDGRPGFRENTETDVNQAHEFGQPEERHLNLFLSPDVGRPSSAFPVNLQVLGRE